MGHKKTNRYNSGKGNQADMARKLDELAEFEQFKADVLPKLRDFIKKGKSAEEIYSWSQSYLAARAVSIGLSSKDEKAALTAIKEVLDRGVGKPADKVEITKRYEKLSDEQLEALLQSQEAELDDEQVPH